MKAVVGLIACVFFLGLAACGDLSLDDDFTLRISGTPGLEFQGSYMTVKATGESRMKSVEGTLPEQYRTKGTIVSCTFQKQSEVGLLKVEVIKGGSVVSSSETRAAFGIASAATQ